MQSQATAGVVASFTLRCGRRRNSSPFACVPGGVERVAGRRATGSWDTAKWLVEKTHAHIENGRLVPDSDEAKKLFASLGSAPVHVDGDRFRAKPCRNIPEGEKLTPAMRRAQLTNIKKAQARVRPRRKAKAR